MKTRILTYILTGVVGMMAIIFSGSCDDSDLVRRVNPNIQIQEELFVAPIASRQVLNLLPAILGMLKHLTDGSNY